MSATSFIGFLLLTFCLCLGTIVLSLDYNMAQTIIANLDITDAFFGLLILILILSL